MTALPRCRSRSSPKRPPAESFCPSRLLLALEGRALLELASVPWALPWLRRRVPRGDGHAVLVLPGFMASDVSTVPLRRFLRNRGYAVSGWGLGCNRGPRPGVLDSLIDQLEALHASSGGTVSLIGWSLGGIFAREVARARPHLVRQVITLGSPLYGAPESSTNVWRLYQRMMRGHGDVAADAVRGGQAPPVPTTSIFSRGDGIVGWAGSVESHGRQIDNVAVNSASHLGLGVNPVVWFVLGNRLAQSEQTWKPFQARGLLRLLISSPKP